MGIKIHDKNRVVFFILKLVEWKFFFYAKNDEERKQHFKFVFLFSCFFFCILPVFPREWSQGYEVVCFWRSRVNHGRQGTAASFLRTAIKFSFHSKYITRSFPFVFALWRHKNHHILRTISLHFVLLTTHDHSDIVYLNNL